MPDSTEFPREVPMSVRMQRVLDAVKRMSYPERLQILVKAGLMTEAEYQEAIERPAPPRKPRRKPKKTRATSAKSAPKPPTS